MINYKTNGNICYTFKGVTIVKIEVRFWRVLKPDGRDSLKNVEYKNDLMKLLFKRLI